MKIIFALLIAQCFVGSAFAQTSIDINKELARAMQNGQEAIDMQQCLQQIDSAKLQDFLRRGEHTKTQIETLCANDDRASAKDLAITFVDLFAEDPVAKQAKQCSELAPTLVPQFSLASFDGSVNGRHICDL